MASFQYLQTRGALTRRSWGFRNDNILHRSSGAANAVEQDRGTQADGTSVAMYARHVVVVD